MELKCWLLTYSCEFIFTFILIMNTQSPLSISSCDVGTHIIKRELKIYIKLEKNVNLNMTIKVT